jgi:hypothetical protein
MNRRAPVGDGIVGLVQVVGAVDSGQPIAAAASAWHEPRCRRCAQPCSQPRVDLRNMSTVSHSVLHSSTGHVYNVSTVQHLVLDCSMVSGPLCMLCGGGRRTFRNARNKPSGEPIAMYWSTLKLSGAICTGIASPAASGSSPRLPTCRRDRSCLCCVGVSVTMSLCGCMSHSRNLLLAAYTQAKASDRTIGTSSAPGFAEAVLRSAEAACNRLRSSVTSACSCRTCRPHLMRVSSGLTTGVSPVVAVSRLQDTARCDSKTAVLHLGVRISGSGTCAILIKLCFRQSSCCLVCLRLTAVCGTCRRLCCINVAHIKIRTGEGLHVCQRC